MLSCRWHGMEPKPRQESMLSHVLSMVEGIGSFVARASARSQGLKTSLRARVGGGSEPGARQAGKYVKILFQALRNYS